RGDITPPNRSRIAGIGSITTPGALLATDCTAVLSSLSKCLIRQPPRDFYRVFVVEPQQSFERIRAQSGAFLVSAFHERFEQNEVLKWNTGIPVYSHYTFEVPINKKQHILDELRLLNITQETLFPSIDEAAKAITLAYSK
ncbi:MAG: hypothetical protein OXC84_05660, partial [Gammaproteobacteria bacterium]|nr:hypothetical protein [Gammaproteobacteria bacterium]